MKLVCLYFSPLHLYGTDVTCWSKVADLKLHLTNSPSWTGSDLNSVAEKLSSAESDKLELE